MELETTSSLYKHLTGLAGTFEVAKQLCLKNYNVSLTGRNFPQVDMFVHNQINGKSVPIQVKAQREANSGGFDIKSNHLDIPGLVVVFITLGSHDKKEIEFYIAPASEVKSKVVGEKRPGIPRKDILNSRWKDNWCIIEKALG